MPLRTKVKIAVTFVTIKPGSQPSLLIDNPINLSDNVGSISSYDKLLEVIDDLVEDDAHDLFFHKDPRHKFSFNGSVLQNGAIYGRRERTDDDDGRATARHLVPIQSDSNFKDNVDNSGIEQYKKRTISRKGRVSKASSKTKQKVLDYVLLELCIVLVKEKLIAPQVITLPLMRSSESISQTSLPLTSNKKRKSPDPFVFKARKLSVTLHAPIETLDKNKSKVTCVPSGKTNKEFEYDLSNFILNDAEDDDDSNNADCDRDEYFMSLFTLSRFRKDMMLLALLNFPEEYLLATRSLGKSCKLFCQKKVEL